MKTNGAIVTSPGNLKTSLPDHLHDENVSCNLYDTPMREHGNTTSDEEKVSLIAGHFHEIMSILGLDTGDDSLKGTAQRVAKMYVKELFRGLNALNRPAITLFENKYHYNQVLVAKNIRLHSTCEHHLLPIIGKAHIGYIPATKVIGLSKLNRLVSYYAQRPQVQERLTNQLARELKVVLGTDDVAIVIDATHLCVGIRGVEDDNSRTLSSHFSGKFNREETRNEFMAMIR